MQNIKERELPLEPLLENKHPIANEYDAVWALRDSLLCTRSNFSVHLDDQPYSLIVSRQKNSLRIAIQPKGFWPARSKNKILVDQIRVLEISKYEVIHHLDRILRNIENILPA